MILPEILTHVQMPKPLKNNPEATIQMFTDRIVNKEPIIAIGNAMSKVRFLPMLSVKIEKIIENIPPAYTLDLITNI